MNSSILLLALFSIAAPPVETSPTPTTRLYVRTIPPGAEVRLDGKPAGKSDDLFVIPAGVQKMTIEVELDGHFPERQAVQIRGGRITRVELKMLPRPVAESETPAVAAKPDSSFIAGISHALHFDGRAGSYVEIPNLDMSRLTFATWVKRDVTAKKQPLIMSARYGGWGVYFSEDPGVVVGSEYQSERHNQVWFTHRGMGGWHSDAEVADRQWHFVAVTLDGNSLSFYVDGKAAGNATMGYKIDSGRGGYCLGGATEYPGESCHSLQGCLAETLVFNKPLNPAEITRLYNRGQRIGKMDGLIAGYHFDEGGGTTAADFSGHGNAGTLQGGVTWVPGREPSLRLGPGSKEGQESGRTPPPALAPYDEKKAKEHQNYWAQHLGVPLEITNSVGMKFVLIPPGEFEMGSSKELTVEELRAHPFDRWYLFQLSNEEPRHHVWITKAFYLGKFAVTQEEYQRVMHTNPSEFSATGKANADVVGQDTKQFPVENVSWKAAVEFCRKMSDLPGEMQDRRRYGLPSEAQWEYACRAENRGPFSFSSGGLSVRKEDDMSNYGWFRVNSEGTPHSIGGKLPSAWGLHDMHGNVWEWCQDWFANDYYVNSPVENPTGPRGGNSHAIRGGCWNSLAIHCRSAYRIEGPQFRSNYLGFRVCLALPDK